MSKFSNSILAASTLGALMYVPQVLAQSSNFNDIRGYWAEQYVTSLADRSIIGGFPDGTFKPSADITRAQFAAIAVKAFNLSSSSNNSNFNDVSPNYWASSAISAVSNSGLVTGFPDGTFRPEDRITRAQALVILAKALGNRFSPNPNELNRYSDRDAVPDWAADSVSKAASARIIANFPDSSRIAPNNLATRGEVAALIYQTIFRLGDRNLPAITIGTLDSSSVPVTSNLNINRIETNINSRQVLSAGDELVVTIYATPRATASFTLVGLNQNNPISTNEIDSGVYEGRYTIRRNDGQNGQTRAKLVATISRQGIRPITQELNQVIAINTNNYPDNNPGNNNYGTLQPQITNVNNNDFINLPVNLVGQTLPNANVRVIVEALRSVGGIIDISQPIFNNTVRANQRGRFNVNIPGSSNLTSGTRYRVRMTATNRENNQSQSSELLLRQQ
ncbi:putative S-layer protein [Synechococcus sp. PCC 7502]|uniref:S-layer homology domain-containing protein n=1 Tax=Synechococcus sp. PCC 7502 TaxID=1173263 RepID=UPI00029FFE0C|nr:S-layer homology domain-containing protein [Synechococcus sp. PCC 7502]AFY73060.1 putative S-layer protein [Synechococcus sp. PCC 7502]